MGSNDNDSDDSRQREQVLRKLKAAVVLCSCFLVVEVAGGLWSGSLAVLSDAAHLFADLTSFAVAIAASHLASLPTTRKHTYGLKRTESLAALFSVTSLAFVSVGLAIKACTRLVWPPEAAPIDGAVMTYVAGIGVVVNVALAFVLGEDHVHLPGGSSCEHHGHGDHSHDHGKGGHAHGKGCGHDHGHHDKAIDNSKSTATAKRGHSCSGHNHDEAKTESSPLLVPQGNHNDHGCGHSHDEDHNKTKEQQPSHRHQPPPRNVNLHAAYLHVLGDLAQSFAVFLGGLVIWYKPEWHAIDPILTLGFSGLVLWSITGVMRSSLAVLLEETPANIDWQEVHDAIAGVPGVIDVHDLHIWCISHGQTAISVHCFSMDDYAIGAINRALRPFGIGHTTIQVNRGSCGTCPGQGETICESHLVQ